MSVPVAKIAFMRGPSVSSNAHPVAVFDGSIPRILMGKPLLCSVGQKKIIFKSQSSNEKLNFDLLKSRSTFQ